MTIRSGALGHLVGGFAGVVAFVGWRKGWLPQEHPVEAAGLVSVPRAHARVIRFQSRMSATPSPEDLRRWVEDWQAVDARLRDEARRKGPSPDAVAAALDLIATAGRLHGWPIPEDRVRQRDDEVGRERWARLRRAFGRQ
jgi:hypothetical protein